ncbi:cell division protein [Limosilactobacillus gastricus]|uniref:Cell division protein FtsL n=1 Tax=Limosilactobacillus gastricus DSM 16045 TaxID=1423749 RepID=A0A0R1VBK7_9LACO|nr:hypothetical protein [Limosilactobacillus gastricus]KRM02862.1 hypothetical protein FC60_GL001558 [Limosilactobacillus gastricus DSM 16045]QGF40785.1 cell division protein [Limosilactobacillus gastricus]
MAANAAPKFNQPLSEPKPQSAPSKGANRQPRLATIKRVRFSPFEKLMLTIGTLVVTALLVLLVSTKITTNNRQEHLQNLQSTASSLSTSNSDQQQEIDEKTNSSNLKSVASKYSMSDVTNSTRNVSK